MIWTLISHDIHNKGIPHEKHKFSPDSSKKLITLTEMNVTNLTLLIQRKNHTHDKIIIKKYSYHQETKHYECERANKNRRNVF